MTLDPTSGKPVTSVLILAAGAGTRLGDSVASKPLRRVGGLPLIERTVVAAHRAGLTDIVVVTGHEAGELESFLEALAVRRGLALRHIRADGWEAGNAASLLAAEEELTEPFVLLMADHVFDHAILTDLLTGPQLDADVVLACDDNVADNPWVVDEEAVKVRFEDGRIRAIGKGITPYDAYDTGVFLCDPAIFAAAHQGMEHGDASLSGVVGRLASAGRATALAIGSRIWVDVDTSRDVATAERFLYSELVKPQDGWVSRRLNRTLSRGVTTPFLLRVAPGITPDQVSLAHLVLAIVAGLGFVAGLPLIAGALVQLSSILDGSDGEIARLKLSASRFGGFFDSVLDRYADGFIVSGMAVFAWQSSATTASVADAAWLVPIIAMMALIGSFMISYTTAKARADLDHRFHGPLVATAGRDVRLLILAIAGVLAVVDPISVFLGLCIVAGLTNLVVVRRLVVAWSRFDRRPAAVMRETIPSAIAAELGSADELAARVLIGPAERGLAAAAVVIPRVDESPPGDPSPGSHG
jgi:choline kinase/phosphatidylglycerophosphate synthase